jgi:ubiquinone/menaquinone biosynthesis C-methylase UbiE
MAAIASAAYRLPSWASEVLAAPPDTIEAGIAVFAVAAADPSIAFYQAVDGAHFHERSSVAFAMTTLDTVVYHGYLDEWRGRAPEPDQPDLDQVVVDIGGGDGRNAWPWLRWGYRRVVVVDPVRAALGRFRDRVAQENPDWLDRLLLIQGDARRLPLRSGCAGRVQAIESLYYLNEDYEIGLAEAVRLLGAGGSLLLSERDYEATLLVRLLYFGGLAGLLDQADGRDAFDGDDRQMVRTRTFTADEIAATVERHGLRIRSQRGVSALSFLLGYLRNHGGLTASDQFRLADTHRLLHRLGRDGRFLRCHVVIADRGPA